MEKIIPYTEEIANSKYYLYIKPNGEIVKSLYDDNVSPECFCAIYCNGELSKKTGHEHSKLSEKEIKVLKQYVEAFNNNEINNKEIKVKYDVLCETFMINVLGYDKINPFYKTIRTTSNEPEQKYNEYIVNGWKIESVPSIVKDENNHFYWDRTNSKKRILI